MAKLSKKELAAHNQAAALVDLTRPLTLDERCFVAENWHEGAGGDQTAASAYFTPCDMANDMLIEMPQHGSFVDLCAGIGRLAFFAGGQCRYEEFRHQYERIVCVEKNPLYVEVGKRILPEAEWICADALAPETRRKIGTVDQAICNPPFGSTTRSDAPAMRYKGEQFDLRVCDLAAAVAPSCWAILPSSRARWDARGNARPSKWADEFLQATGLDFHRFASIDGEFYRDQWRGTAPSVDFCGFGEEYEAERESTRTIYPAPPIAVATASAQQPQAQLALF